MKQMYEPVVGLEVHVELNTKTKMFCRCSADYFGKAPNTHTCPVCLGLPGALPYINQEAIEKCLKIGLALNCQAVDSSRFERKNYFYPDLPKGYQISQYRWPLSINGFLEIAGKDNQTIKVRINRVHQEEDTGKLSHQNGQTLIDFNRSGVPLVEIVTEPDFHDPAQVKDFAQKLQQIFRHLDVSGADMERGDMRLEANVSVRPEHVEGLPNYRIELKNINSFRFMVAALEYEIQRQIKELEEGKTLTQETRGWNEDKKITYLQRSKEEAHDYRYFPDPDLPEIKNSSQKAAELKDEVITKLPQTKIDFWKSLGVSQNLAEILISQGLATSFEKAYPVGEKHGFNPQAVASLIINKKIDFNKISPEVYFQNLVQQKAGMIEDVEELTKIAQEVIKENPQMVDLYKKGKTTVVQALVGAVMRKTQGKADPTKAREILEKLLIVS